MQKDKLKHWRAFAAKITASGALVVTVLFLLFFINGTV